MNNYQYGNQANAHWLLIGDRLLSESMDLNQNRINAFWDALAQSYPGKEGESIAMLLSRVASLTTSPNDLRHKKRIENMVAKWEDGGLHALRRCVIDDAGWSDKEKWGQLMASESERVEDMRSETVSKEASIDALREGGKAAFRVGGTTLALSFLSLLPHAPILGDRMQALAVGSVPETLLVMAGASVLAASGTFAWKTLWLGMVKPRFFEANSLGCPPAIERMNANGTWEENLCKWDECAAFLVGGPLGEQDHAGQSPRDFSKERGFVRSGRAAVLERAKSDVVLLVAEALAFHLSGGLDGSERRRIRNADEETLIRATAAARAKLDAMAREKGLSDARGLREASPEQFSEAVGKTMLEAVDEQAHTMLLSGRAGLSGRLSGSEIRRALLDPTSARLKDKNGLSI